MQPSKPKLVFIISKYDPKTATHYHHIYQLITALSKTFQIFVFAESGIGQSIKISGISGGYVQTNTNPFIKIYQRIAILTKLRLQGYRLFYCHYAHITSLLAWLIASCSNAKLVMWMCSKEHLYFKSWSWQTLAAKLTHDLPIALTIKLPHLIVTCTPTMRTYYHRQFGRPKEKTIVIPNFVCPEIYFPIGSKAKRQALRNALRVTDKTTLLYVHWLSKRKGADRLIHLAYLIKKQKIPAQIIALGEGPLLPSLKHQTAAKNLRKVLHFQGAVESNQIALWLQASDFLIMPPRTEEFGRVQIEAIAVGLPILAPKTESSSYVLSPTQQKYLVPQKQIYRLVDQARQLVENPNAYNKIAKAGLKHVKQFYFEKVAQKYQHLFLKLTHQ